MEAELCRSHEMPQWSYRGAHCLIALNESNWTYCDRNLGAASLSAPIPGTIDTENGSLGFELRYEMLVQQDTILRWKNRTARRHPRRPTGLHLIESCIQHRCNVLLFANNPIYRGETIGSYNLIFNAILNYNQLSRQSDQAPAGKRTETSQRLKINF